MVKCLGYLEAQNVEADILALSVSFLFLSDITDSSAFKAGRQGDWGHFSEQVMI